LRLCVRSSDAAHSRSLGRAVEAAHQLGVLFAPVFGKLTLQLLPGFDQRLLLQCQLACRGIQRFELAVPGWLRWIAVGCLGRCFRQDVRPSLPKLLVPLRQQCPRIGWVRVQGFPMSDCGPSFSLL